MKSLVCTSYKACLLNVHGFPINRKRSLDHAQWHRLYKYNAMYTTACICINDSYYASWDLQLVIPQPLPRIQCKLRSQLLLIRFVLYRLSTHTYNSTLMHRTSNNCGNMVLIIGSPVDHRSMVIRESPAICSCYNLCWRHHVMFTDSVVINIHKEQILLVLVARSSVLAWGQFVT